MANPLTPQTAPAEGETPPEEENKQQQRALLRALLLTVEHFFGSFSRLFRPVSDPRQPALITYPLPMVLTTGVLLFLLRVS